MALTCPDWLARRGGGLKLAPEAQTWFVLFGQAPQYALQPVPVQGKFGCHIKQTINGQRIESSGTYPSPEEAMAGGLGDLRKALGW